MDTRLLTEDLKRDEGVILHSYNDHLGYATIGIGRLIDKRKGGGISLEEAEYLLANDIIKVEKQLIIALPWYGKLTERRQRALCNMCFQLGLSGLLGFKNTLRYLKEGSYIKAAENARQSLWYRQTPERAERVIKQFL